MSKPPENVRGAFVACKWQLELQGLLKKTTNKQTNNQTNKQNKNKQKTKKETGYATRKRVCVQF